jgi:hypothetical protein
MSINRIAPGLRAYWRSLRCHSTSRHPDLKRSSDDWDWFGADKELQRAIQRNPSYADAHGLHAEVLWRTGRINKAVAETRLTVERDPLSLDNNDTLGSGVPPVSRANRKQLDYFLFADKS